MLQAAAYIVCAYLSGMRDSEIQAMKRGCLSVVRDEDGAILRHRIKSTAYKGKGSGGAPAEWVTIAPVADAIGVLELLCKRAADARGLDTLWPVLSLTRSRKSHVSAEIVRQINAYRDHLNTLFGTDEAPAIPPGPDGKPWRITTRQFRRTIAWHIANRPFGMLLGLTTRHPFVLRSTFHRLATEAPQFHENHILSGTLGFNLLMGRNWPASDEELLAARELCIELGLGPLLERMPAGMMQMVGETGWQLSHGERSRIFLARALLQDAQLTVLDESFAALDPETLRECLNCAFARARTLMVIAHP